MGDSTHTLTMNGIAEQDTATVTVPADVQREFGIAIDDELEVTIDNLDGLFDSISFTGNQTAGDRVTVPAEVVRKAGIEKGKTYPVMFEKVAAEEDDEADLDDEEYTVPDDEIKSELKNIEEEFEDSEFKSADTIEDESESEEESEGLGELFQT